LCNSVARPTRSQTRVVLAKVIPRLARNYGAGAAARVIRPAGVPNHARHWERLARRENHMSDKAQPAHLERGFGLLQATAAGMANMVGVGPFITIPLILVTMGGPQCMLGWLVALAIAICDGQIWAELSASLPGEGGTYIYLREAFRRYAGKLFAFLFIWQFFLSMPMEVASGNIGLADYLSYLWPSMTAVYTIHPLPASGWHFQLGVVQIVAAGVALFTIWLHYRRIGSVGNIAVALWVGMLVTTGWTIIAGLSHFNSAQAFSFPPNAFNFSRGFMLGLGGATLIAMYDYLGYYSACYVGEEVRNPGFVLPRAILISVVAVAAIYILINISMIAVIPWREAIHTKFIGSLMMERIYGRPAAIVMTLLIVYTAYGSIYALMLGYSRIPFAAARDGYFFKQVAAIHPTRHIPHVSLLLVGGVVAAASLLDLKFVIDSCIVTRIVIQFMMQAAALVVLRRDRPKLKRPFKMWLYPVPAIISFLGFLYIFVTADWRAIVLTFAWMAAGVIAFLYWAKQNHEWPFAPLPKDGWENGLPPEIAAAQDA
jgi:amino acid transporter